LEVRESHLQGSSKPKYTSICTQASEIFRLYFCAFTSAELQAVKSWLGLVVCANQLSGGMSVLLSLFPEVVVTVVGSLSVVILDRAVF
jgi:hypothetical protein